MREGRHGEPMPLSLKDCTARTMKVLKDTQRLGFVTLATRSLFLNWETYRFTATARAWTAGHTRKQSSTKVAEFWGLNTYVTYLLEQTQSQPRNERPDVLDCEPEPLKDLETIKRQIFPSTTMIAKAKTRKRPVVQKAESDAAVDSTENHISGLPCRVELTAPG